jgi:hypothetical protein
MSTGQPGRDGFPACCAWPPDMISKAGADQPWPDRPMDTDDIDPETGEAFGVDPDAYDCEVT